MQKIGLNLADEIQINSDEMINISVKTVDGIDLSSHNFHVAKVKKSYLGMDLLKKLDAVIHVNEEHIACRNGLKIPFEKNNVNQLWCLQKNHLHSYQTLIGMKYLF